MTVSLLNPFQERLLQGRAVRARVKGRRHPRHGMITLNCGLTRSDGAQGVSQCPHNSVHETLILWDTLSKLRTSADTFG